MKLADSELNTGLDDSCGNGVAGKPCGVVNIKLFHKMLPVLFDRFNADLKFCSDLFIGHPLSDQLQDLYFTSAQKDILFFDLSFSIKRCPVAVIKALRYGRAEKCLSFVDFPDSLGQNLHRGLFGDIS